MAKETQSIDLPKTQNVAFDQTMNEIVHLELERNLMELDAIGFTRLRGVLTPTQVEAARTAIKREMEIKTNRRPFLPKPIGIRCLSFRSLVSDFRNLGTLQHATSTRDFMNVVRFC